MLAGGLSRRGFWGLGTWRGAGKGVNNASRQGWQSNAL